jgi:uncharacterized protein (TIGR03435 family)
VTPLLLTAISPAFSQLKSSTEFDVASVRPNVADDRIVMIDVGPGGRFTARGYTLVLLMQHAYAVMDWNVTGGPDWIRIDRFDVSAKADVSGNLTEHQLQPMLQGLLAERFKLKVHDAPKQISGYALVIAKGGPRIKAAADPPADGEERQDEFRMTFNVRDQTYISMPCRPILPTANSIGTTHALMGSGHAWHWDHESRAEHDRSQTDQENRE